MYKKIISILLCTVLAASLFTACGGEKPSHKITVVLDWTPNTNHTGLFVAQELGYFKEAGLEVEMIQPPEGGALALVATGKADFAVSFQEEVLVAANAEKPLPIVAVAALVEHNTGGILSLKEKGITSFKAMEGKTYGSWEMPIYDAIVNDCISADGGDPAKVSFVPNSATDSITGITRDFDTVWVYEGWDKIIADTKDIETNFIRFKDINPVFDYYTPVLVANSEKLKDNRDTIVSFLKATEKGYTYAKDKPSEAANILSKHAPEIDENVLLASQQFLSGEYFSTKWGYIEPDRWNNFYAWMKDKGLLKPTANTSAFENILYN